MVTLAERRRLESRYCERPDGRAAVAKCVAGLLVLIGIAAIGATGSTDSDAVALSVQSVASGR